MPPRLAGCVAEARLREAELEHLFRADHPIAARDRGGEAIQECGLACLSTDGSRRYRGGARSHLPAAPTDVWYGGATATDVRGEADRPEHINALLQD